MTPNQVHIRDNTVIIECSGPRAAVELAERLLHAKPVAYVTMHALARLIADDTAVTQATGRAMATDESIGLFPGPQAGARKQAFEECLGICEGENLDSAEDDCDRAYSLAIQHCVQAIRNRMEGK